MPRLFIILLICSIRLSFPDYSSSAHYCPDIVSEDTTHTTFSPSHIILPAALISIGALGVSNGWLTKINREVRNGFQNLRHECRWHGDDYIQYLPIATYLGLGFLDTNSNHNFMRRLFAGATAYAFMGIMVNATKFLVAEKRPDSGTLNSFPSGHTATAFMGAELVRMEYTLPYAIGAYTIAGLTAILRLYNDRHWLNDIVAGAGIGILCARMAYWMLPLYDKWFFSKNKKRRPGEYRIIAPYIDSSIRGAGLTSAWCF